MNFLLKLRAGKIKGGDKMLTLEFVWEIRMRFRAEGNKLWAEGNKLWAEGDKLRAEGDKLWAEGILAAHGNIKLEWENWHEDKQSYECHLETGEVFIP